ncbi:hypothetical protein RJT34_17308 [Clitoria ternatea]|uniref:RING-type E3 ubiquitin transferase n=1 Tax=Clitoria ternatea TaxID=43366 RepID=A0AAN9JA12_CLITE
MDTFPYWIVIIVALTISVTFFTITMLGWCIQINHIPSLPTTGLSFDEKFPPCLSLESHSVTFQYRVADAAAEGTTNQTECVICLTPFEEEESVRKLHSCKHMFHTCCIDRWLGSHSGCPLCRTQIDKVITSPSSTVALGESDHQMIMVIVHS